MTTFRWSVVLFNNNRFERFTNPNHPLCGWYLIVELEKIIKERNFSNKEVNTLKVRIEQKEKERVYSNQEADNLRSQLERKKMECDALKQETDKLRIDIGEITDKHTFICHEVGELRI